MPNESTANDTIAAMFRPLFDSGIKEIQGALSEIQSNKQKTAELGSFLSYHLILEKYLEDYILAVYPEIKRVDGHKVSFKHKLDLIKKLNTLNAETFRAIDAINQIRNGLAHSLSGREINEGHRQAVYCIIDRWDKGGELKQKLDKINNIYRTAEFAVYLILVELLMGITLRGTMRNIEEEFQRNRELMFEELIKL